MKVLQINFYDMFSTGNIMLNIARVARKKGHTVHTASKMMKLSLDRNRNDRWHFYIGNRFANTVHRYFSWMSDFQDCGSITSTICLIRRIEKLQPDIIHLHDIVGWYINIGILFRYLKRKNIPVVWTFHDCWAFTGRCIYFDAVGCNRWRTGCGQCPQLNYMPRTWWFDRSAWNFKHKRKLFTGLSNLTIVTPSIWLKNLTKESFMQKYEVRVINNGIDLDVFKPTHGATYDRLMKHKKKIVLGVAAPWSERKGLKIFLQLAKELSEDYMVVIVGMEPEHLENEKRILAIRRTADQNELAQIYSAATVFANPTYEDNFPTVNLEALACGTPVVTFDTGGSPESVDKNVGIVVEKGNYTAFRKAIEEIGATGRTHFTKACIEKARCNYNKEDRFDDYVKLYENIIKR